MAEDWLHADLSKYAEWSLLHERNEWSEEHAYPDATPQWHAQYNPGDIKPHSYPPRGTMCPDDIAHIQSAYINLLPSEMGREVQLVKDYYELAVRRRLTPGFKPWESLSLVKTQFYDMRKLGETAIRAYLHSGKRRAKRATVEWCL